MLEHSIGQALTRPTAGRLRSQWTFRILAGLVLTITVVVAVQRAHPTGGPLAPMTGNRALTGAIRAPGVAVSVGIIYFDRYDARTPVVLESVRPAAPVDGLRVLGFSVIRPEENGTGIGSVDGYPPEGFVVHRLEGFAFTGDARQIEVIVGVESTRPGAFEITDFVLRYRIGSSEYEATYPFGAAICTARGLASFC
jgi:hypothetical protein